MLYNTLSASMSMSSCNCLVILRRWKAINMFKLMQGVFAEHSIKMLPLLLRSLSMVAMRLATIMSCCRGRADTIATKRQRIHEVLADIASCVCRGGIGRCVSRSRHTTRSTDSQHCHHDGDLRTRRLPRLSVVGRRRRWRLPMIVFSPNCCVCESSADVLIHRQLRRCTAPTSCIFVTSAQRQVSDCNGWMLSCSSVLSFVIAHHCAPAQGDLIAICVMLTAKRWLDWCSSSQSKLLRFACLTRNNYLLQ